MNSYKEKKRLVRVMSFVLLISAPATMYGMECDLDVEERTPFDDIETPLTNGATLQPDVEGEAFLAEIPNRVARFNEIKSMPCFNDGELEKKLKSMKKILRFVQQAYGNTFFVRCKRQKPQAFMEVAILFRELKKEYDLIHEGRDSESQIGFHRLGQSMEFQPYQIIASGEGGLFDHTIEYINECHQMITTLCPKRACYEIFSPRIDASFSYIERCCKCLSGMSLAEVYTNYDLLKEAYRKFKAEMK